MNKLYRIARHLHRLKLLKKATKPGQFTTLDEFINGEIYQVEGLSQDSDAVAWAQRELYKKFDNGLKAKPELLRQINSDFSKFVEEVGDKSEANRLSYEKMFVQHHPSIFFAEGNNVHVGLGQIFYWAKSTNKDLSKSSPVTWDNAISASNKFIKSQINKGEEVTSLQALKSTDNAINYFMQNPDIPDSDLHVEIIAVPKGMSEKDLSDMENRCRREGQEGAHCLYSNYWGTIKSGQAMALSIRDEKGSFIATMRIDIDDLIELKGYNNASPPDEYKQPILNWVMNLVDQGILRKISASGMTDVGRLMTPETMKYAFESGNEDLIAASILSGEANERMIYAAVNDFPKSHKIAKAVASSSQTPDHIQKRLLSMWSNDQGVLSAFGMSEFVDSEVARELLNHPNKAIRWSLLTGKRSELYRDRVTKEDLEGMSAIKDGRFDGRWLAYALGHPDINPEKIDEVVQDPNIPVSVIASVLTNPTATITAKEKIYLSMSDEERKSMGGRGLADLAKKTTSLEVLDKIVDAVEVKSTALKEVLYNTDATVDIKKRALERMPLDTKVKWISESKAPIELLRDVGLDPRASRSSKYWVIKNPNTTIGLLREMAEDKSENVRGDIAGLTDDEFLLDELSKDESYDVRFVVAGNPHTSPETLLYLSKDIEPKVRRGVADNRRTPPQALKELAKDPHSAQLVAQNKNTPEDTLQFLLQDDGNLQAVAKNPNLSTNMINELVDKVITMNNNDVTAQRDTLEVLTMAAESERTAPETISKVFSKYKDIDNGTYLIPWSNFATNPNTPGEVLDQLLDVTNGGWPTLQKLITRHRNVLPSTTKKIKGDI